VLRIFIGWDSRFPEPADVLRHSLLEHASIPLDIRYLKLDELDLAREHDPRASTEFTYSRFLVPHLCGFRGRALFLDNDMLCFADVRELAELDMDGLALRVVQHDYQPANTVKMYGCPQTSYPRKNWSSFMLINCGHEDVRRLTPEVVNRSSGQYLHRFQWLSEGAIGELPLEYNYLEGWNTKEQCPDPIAVHFTRGGPWFDEYKNVEYADEWNKYASIAPRLAK
jgi:lipopolysaccharide biosynthesis glycosyltransferase